MASGFIYVLINPAMPGLTKVGKTTRPPNERVAELSSATGVPSPFLLAYEQPVLDTDAAERWVHIELERNGFRLTERREFFNAPLHVVIKTVSQASEVVSETQQTLYENPTRTGSSDELAEELCDAAAVYLQGSDTVLKSERKALKLYEQAAALGHAHACSMAGGSYRWGLNGAREDIEKAVAYYNRSTALGIWSDYALLAGVFLERGQVSAAKKYWFRFFEAARDDYGDVRDSSIRMYGVWYCISVASAEIEHCIEDSVIAHFSKLLLEGIEKASRALSDDPDVGYSSTRKSELAAAKTFIRSYE